MKKKHFYVEHLDDGALITIDGKKKAVETLKRAKEILIDRFTEMISRVDHQGINNMSVTVEVYENAPISVQEK